MNHVDSNQEADVKRAQNQTKQKKCYHLYSFYKSNAADYKEKKNIFPVCTLHQFVKFRLIKGIDLCCFNIGYVTYKMMTVSPKAWINELDVSQEILGQTASLLNHIADEIDFQFEDLGDAIDLDNKALRFFTDKETFKLMTNITARDHGRVQDLTFEYFFENPYQPVVNPTPLDMIWGATSLLCATAFVLRKAEVYNRSVLYRDYTKFSQSIRFVAALLAEVPNFITKHNTLNGENND